MADRFKKKADKIKIEIKTRERQQNGREKRDKIKTERKKRKNS